MIRDLSTTLRAILANELPKDLGIQVVFDRPVAQFRPAQSTIDLFLFDIRENVELRDFEPTVSRSDGQAIVRRPPMRVDCSYMVTAWAGEGIELELQEHLLLGQTLQVFSRHPTIPVRFLQGSLRSTATESLPIPLSVATAAVSRQPNEFWTSLGIPVRAYLIVTATIAIDLNDPQPELFPLVTTHQIDFQDMEADLLQETIFQIGGQVRLANGQPLAAAQVTLVECHQTTQTDADGYYQFSAVAAGDYTLEIQQLQGEPQQSSLKIPGTEKCPYDVHLN
ncbi:MAG: Pvc16 family protein [Leptolyngbyaceae cyanobacterium bins.302]|nr:Pvc16 family protein [Leptolyngbyaceae cyanobacterium bins.302]